MPKLVPGCLAAVVMIGANLALAAPPSESSEQNLRESEQYERLLCTNAAFRQKLLLRSKNPTVRIYFQRHFVNCLTGSSVSSRYCFTPFCRMK